MTDNPTSMLRCYVKVCYSFFSHYNEEIADRNTLEKENAGLRLWSITVREVWMEEWSVHHGEGGRSAEMIRSWWGCHGWKDKAEAHNGSAVKKQREACWGSAHSLLLPLLFSLEAQPMEYCCHIQSGPSLLHLDRNTQRCVSQVTVDPIKLTPQVSLSHWEYWGSCYLHSTQGHKLVHTTHDGWCWKYTDAVLV